MADKKQGRVPRGELELALVTALWGRKDRAATIRELYELVGRPRGIVYTTVAKVLDRLVEKGMVGRRRAGRAYTYYARIKQEETQRAIARNVIGQLLGVDVHPAIAALVGALEDISPALLDELAAEIENQREVSDES